MNIHTFLTTPERDTIDAAQGRIRRLSALMAVVKIQQDNPLESTEIGDDAEGALNDVLDLIYRDAVVLDEVLEGADGERKQREDHIVKACARVAKGSRKSRRAANQPEGA